MFSTTRLRHTAGNDAQTERTVVLRLRPLCEELGCVPLLLQGTLSFLDSDRYAQSSCGETLPHGCGSSRAYKGAGKREFSSWLLRKLLRDLRLRDFSFLECV